MNILRKARRLPLRAALCGSLVLACMMPVSAQNGFKAPPNDKPTNYGQTFGKPFIDVDEWRDKPRRHRYVHGGFEGTHTRFSVYLPPKELYKERFLLQLEGGVGGQDKMITGPNWDWAFNLAFDELGAYLVETNEGHYPDEGIGSDNDHDLWQASGYATSYIRNIAKEMYGAAPKRGYTNGCSGGGIRSSMHVELMPDMIDGSVPQAFSDLARLQWGAYAMAGTRLGEKTKDVVDALEVGGSGDPYKGLNKVQSDWLRETLQLGWPRDGIAQFKNGFSALTVYMIHVRDRDPTYYEDFWNKPGYVGHDNPKEVADLIVDTEVTVEKLVTLGELEKMSGGRSTTESGTFSESADKVLQRKQGAYVKFDGQVERLTQATITILSGKDKGKTLQVGSVGPGNLIRPFIPRAPFGFDNVQVGDKLKISNRDYVAYMYYYRHAAEVLSKQLGLQTASHRLAYPEFKVLMDDKGQPQYVQRTKSIFDAQPATFKGKMIVVTGTADEPVYPTGMTAYERRVRNNLGAKADDQFRLWWVENHPHCSAPLTGPRSTQYVPATGLVSQAIRDLMKWTEDGVAPPASTGYRLDNENALVLDASGKGRRGIQPVVKLLANGSARAEVAVGTPVKFSGTAEVPPGTGTVVKAQFDFDGQGTWPESVAAADGSSATLSASATHTFTKPGTYFVAFRVGAHREGAKGKGEPVYNIGRARVVVK